MKRIYSPLRYPGGKANLISFFKELIEEQRLKGTTYIEPFAGGANVALSLLIDGYVSDIMINDADKSIFSFWYAILNNTDAFIQEINRCSLSIKEWDKQKEILNNPEKHSALSLGFAAFFLNRTNFSGVVTAGPIGGREQKGTYKIGARFNKKQLIEKIKAIAAHKEHITVSCLDAIDLIKNIKNKRDCLIYFDPPYYVQGKKLYTNFYKHKDHAILAKQIAKLPMGWVLTYDNVPQISELYSKFEQKDFLINYSANTHVKGKELMFLNNLPLPSRSFMSNLK